MKRLNGERKPGLGAPPTKKQSVGVHAKPLDNRRPALSASMADLMVKDFVVATEEGWHGRRVDAARRRAATAPLLLLPTDDDDDEPPPPC